MTPYLAKHKRQTTAFFVMVLLLTATMTASITSPAQAAVPLLDIAYNTGGNIWIQRADGTTTQLTSNVNSSRNEYIPEVSPDGLQIAFAEHGAIWIMSVGGSNPYQVSSLGTTIPANTTIDDSRPRWSPDGGRISFERDVKKSDAAGTFISATSDIVVLNISSGFESTITSSDRSASGPAAWSPDSSHLAYWKTDTAGLSIIGADGSGEHPLSLQTPNYPSDPAWAPDGNTIYFDTDDPHVSGIVYFTSSDKFTTTLNAPAKNLTTDVTDFEPHLTPDGKAVGFRRGGVIETLNLADGTLLPQPLTGVQGFSFIPGTKSSGPPATSGAYVAMGDSYSAGQGVPNFLPPAYIPPSNTDRCHRSYSAYSRKLVETIPSLKLTFVACSGAILSDLYFGQNGEPPQLNSLDPSTNVVSLTIGGNDAGFPSVLDFCVLAFHHPDAACQQHGSAIVDNAIRRLQNGQQLCPPATTCVRLPALHDLYAKIHTAAPNARIYVLNYPSLFRADATAVCRVGAFSTVTAANQIWMAKETQKLNNLISSEVLVAQGKGVPVSLVNAATPFVGHELCSAQPWFNGVWLTVSNQINAPFKPLPESFHPNFAGQANMSETLRTMLLATGG